MFMLQKSNKKASSRQQINIKGVKDGILILPGNRYRAILRASSINFELKSDEEQDAIIETYQNFLNSLACPIQILVRIREMDMQKYLDNFRSSIEGENKPIYRQQIQNYTEFVETLVTTNKILARHFYIVVPYSGKAKAEFEDIYEQLSLNCDMIAKGLSRMGVQTSRLNSLEVLDLFYSSYNPAQAKRQPLADQTVQLFNKSYF